MKGTKKPPLQPKAKSETPSPRTPSGERPSSSGAAASSVTEAPLRGNLPEDKLHHPGGTSFTSGGQALINDRLALRKLPPIRS
eukprot:4879496-Pyramimonas_sp.AAC.1